MDYEVKFTLLVRDRYSSPQSPRPVSVVHNVIRTALGGGLEFERCCSPREALDAYLDALGYDIREWSVASE